MNSVVLDVEKWKDVWGYEDYYQVSTLGRVRSKDRVVRAGKAEYNKRGRILKQDKTTTGYLKVGLSVNGKRKEFKVHRLVANAFISNEFKKPYINHKDMDTKNNNVSNLEWCTQKENMQHYVNMTGKSVDGHKIEIINLINKGFSNNEIMKEIGIDKYKLNYRLKKFKLKNKNKSKRKYGIIKEDVECMIKNGLSVAEIAIKYNCSQSNISHFIKNNQIRRCENVK